MWSTKRRPAVKPFCSGEVDDVAIGWSPLSAHAAISLASQFLRDRVRTVDAVRVHESGTSSSS
eukprot:127595-Pyramimonas_sp.AAC.1